MNRARGKARFVGFLYLIATIFVAVMAFFPVLQGTSVGTMSVLNFWRAFLQMGSIGDSTSTVLVNVAVAGLYGILLLSVVINVIRLLSKYGKLSAGKRTNKAGYDWTVFLKTEAMEKMGKIFSGTYCIFIVFLFMIHLIAGASFTVLFYVTLLIGLIIHFWAGLVSANVGRFLDSDTEKELKSHGLSVKQKEKILKDYEFEEQPKYGRIAPFFRNLAQVAFVGLIMYFISKVNVMMNALHWLEKGAWSNFGSSKSALFLYGGIPLLQLLICIWTVVLLKHATAPTEFDRRGKEGKGRKNFGIFSLFVLLTAAALFVLTYIASKKVSYIMPSMGTLYIAVVALAAVIEELFMCRLPNIRGRIEDYYNEEDDEAQDASSPVNGLSVPVTFVPSVRPVSGSIDVPTSVSASGNPPVGNAGNNALKPYSTNLTFDPSIYDWVDRYSKR